MAVAFVFPGQGSQTVGMGKALADSFAPARQVFAEVDEALGEALSRTIFEGPRETLTLTQNAQPALMAVSLAVMRVLEAEAGLVELDADLELRAAAAAGAIVRGAVATGGQAEREDRCGSHCANLTNLHSVSS